MADKWKSDPEDEPIHGAPNEELRGIVDDDVDFDAGEDLDDEEEEEEGSTF
jgi:hypothetical protein